MFEFAILGHAAVIGFCFVIANSVDEDEHKAMKFFFLTWAFALLIPFLWMIGTYQSCNEVTGCTEDVSATTFVIAQAFTVVFILFVCYVFLYMIRNGLNLKAMKQGRVTLVRKI
jgi:hypothetical protein